MWVAGAENHFVLIKWRELVKSSKEFLVCVLLRVHTKIETGKDLALASQVMEKCVPPVEYLPPGLI